MTILWKWDSLDGTIDDIRTLDWPLGYTHRSEQMFFANILGKNCVQFAAEWRNNGGDRTPNIVLLIQDITEFWKKRLLYFPLDYDILENDGGTGWCNIGCGITHVYEDAAGVIHPWSSGNIQVHQRPTYPDELFMFAHYHTDSTKEGGDDQTPYSDFTFERGKWYEMIEHVILHPTSGRVEVWFDGQRKFNLFPICTDPLGNTDINWGTPRTIWRNYMTNIPRNGFPQSIYYTDLILQTHPFDTAPMLTVDSSPPNIPFTIGRI